MIYLTLGNGIRQGIPLYKGLHDNKPPLLYILAGIAGNVMFFRMILAFWSFATIILFWHLTKALFPKKFKFQKIATIIFALLTTLPLLEGQIANAEVFMIGPIIAAFWILLSYKPTTKNMFSAGCLFGIATLFKVPAAFDMPAIIIFWLITSDLKKENIKKVIKNSFILISGFLLPILSTFFWYFLKDALKEYVIAAFLQNFGYLSSWRPSDVQKSFLLKNAPLVIRGAIVMLGTFVLFLKRKRFSKPFIFINLWLLFSLFAITLSERPYPHYLIQAVPSVSLLLAILFTSVTKEQTLSIIPLTIAFLVPFYFKFWYYPTTAYYSRFLEFATGRISKEEYFNRFDSNVNRNYKIASFLMTSSKPKDKIFVLGDSPPIYALSRRFPPIKYIANYHIKDFYNEESLVHDLSLNEPLFIVTLPNEPLPLGLYRLLYQDYTFLENIDGAKIWYLLKINNEKAKF